MVKGAHYMRNAIPLRYGNGCKYYHDCFSCPLPDCNFGPGKRGRNLSFIVATNKDGAVKQCLK